MTNQADSIRSAPSTPGGLVPAGAPAAPVVSRLARLEKLRTDNAAELRRLHTTREFLTSRIDCLVELDLELSQTIDHLKALV